jgi:hypothetical protein
MIVDTVEAAKKPERASAVETFVERTAILRESGVASLDALLTATLGASGQDLLPQAVATTAPGALKAVEATTIGRGFDAIIRVSATPSDAVDELLRKYPAVNAAAQQHGWVRPMLEKIAQRRLATAPLGLKLRLALGVAFSIGDTTSDAVQIVALFLAGQSLRAFAILAMIVMNLATQALIVIESLPLESGNLKMRSNVCTFVTPVGKSLSGLNWEVPTGCFLGHYACQSRLRRPIRMATLRLEVRRRP